MQGLAIERANHGFGKPAGGADETVEGTGGGKPVDPAKRGDHVLACFLSFAPVFDDLEIGVVSADFGVTKLWEDFGQDVAYFME